MTGPVELTVRAYVKFDRDIDSSLKILLDVLQGKVYENDKQVSELHVYKYKDAANPRIEVTVHTREEEL